MGRSTRPPTAIRRALSRFYFAWSMLVGVVVSLVLVVPVVLANVLRPSARTFWRSMRVWAGTIFAILGFRVDARGDAPDDPVVFVANHQSMVDIPILLLGIPGPFVFVAKKEVLAVPIVGFVLRKSRCVTIDRSAAGPGLAEAAERVSSGDPVLMFPEGTRSYGDHLGRFKTGAFRLAAAADVPVVPVAVDGAAQIMNERVFEAWPGRVRVRVGGPMLPDPGEGPAEWAERSRDAVAGLMPEGSASARLPVAA